MDFSFVLIWVLVGVTSSLSGVLGMGGGLLLMGALSWLFPVGPAMVVHGLAQLAANGSRTILHLPHVSWKILPGYLIGSLMAASCFAFVKLIPSKALVFFVLGLLPFIAIYGKRFFVLDILKPLHRIGCGGLVTFIQLACGASGPALDIFYVHTQLNRHQVVASKALTQSLGHALKLFYYGVFMDASPSLNLGLWQMIGIVAAALMGTIIGGYFLNEASDKSFQVWSSRILLFIGGVYLIKGGMEVF